MAHLFQFIDAAGQPRFTGASRPHQQERIAGGDRDLLDAVDQAVERRVSRFDTALEVGDAFPLLLLKTGSDPVVA